MAESAVNQEFGVIESNEDNAAWHYFGSITNPLFTAINYNGDESRPSAEIVCYMNGYNDNRRASYFVNEDGAFDSDVYVPMRPVLISRAIRPSTFPRTMPSSG